MSHQGHPLPGSRPVIPRPIAVLYDGGCPLCLASVDRLQRWDTEGILEFMDARDVDAVAARFPGIPRDEGLAEMRLVLADGKVLGGFEAARALAAVLPRLRPLAPLLFVPGMALPGRAVYRFIARNRPRGHSCAGGSCGLPDRLPG